MLYENLKAVDLVCAEERERPMLNHAYLRDGMLYAADGFVALAIPAHAGNTDEDGLIPKEAIKIARETMRDITLDDQDVVVESSDDDMPEVRFNRPGPGEYWDTTLKRLRTVFTRRGPLPETHTPHAIVNARYLWRLARGFYGDDSTSYAISLYLPVQNERPLTPIIVTPTFGDADAIGAVMPLNPGHWLIDGDPVDAESEKADYHATMTALTRAIDNDAETVTLDGDLLRDLRQLLTDQKREDTSDE